MQTTQSRLQNCILARLSESDFKSIADYLKPCEFPLSRVLIEPDVEMTSVFFMETGLASIVIPSADHGSIESGVVGREGFVAYDAVLGATTMCQRVEVQIAGTGHMIALPILMDAMTASISLREVCLRFVRVMIAQSAHTAFANAVNTVNERLARWLLMCDDRSVSSELQLTHKFLAVMLAVRRASVTDAVQFLEGRGLIRAERRYITISNRPALEAFAGESYGKAESEYRRLLGPMRVTAS